MSSFNPWSTFEKKVHKIQERFCYSVVNSHRLAWCAKWTTTVVVFHKKWQSFTVLPFSCSVCFLLPIDMLCNVHFKSSLWPRYVCVFRDGREVAMSLYNHFMNITAEVRSVIGNNKGFDNFDVFYDVWLNNGNQPFWSDYFDHLASWFECAHLYENILLVNYSEMQRDLTSVILKLAKFLDIHVDETAASFSKILHHSSFEYMKQHEELFELPAHIMRPGNFMHKGVRGRWREALSASQKQAYWDKATQKWSPELLEFVHKHSTIDTIFEEAWGSMDHLNVYGDIYHYIRSLESLKSLKINANNLISNSNFLLWWHVVVPIRLVPPVQIILLSHIEYLLFCILYVCILCFSCSLFENHVLQWPQNHEKGLQLPMILKCEWLAFDGICQCWYIPFSFYQLCNSNLTFSFWFNFIH